MSVEEKWPECMELLLEGWDGVCVAVDGSSGGDMSERMTWREVLPRRARP